MNNETPAALLSRIADLEQQLKLSDEGVSRLAERCFALEQEVQSYLAARPQRELHADSPSRLHPTLYYDAGFGFSEADTLTSQDCLYDELTGAMAASFELPTDVQALRLDPGELPCCITELGFSDDRIQAAPCNGWELPDGGTLFLRGDPNYRLSGLNRYPAGMKLVITYNYFPLESLSGEPLFRIVLDGMQQFQQEKTGEEQHIQELNHLIDEQQKNLEIQQQAIAQLNRDILDLRQQNLTLQSSNEAYDNALRGMQSSTSWKLTAPIRRLIGLFHRGQ